MPSNRRQVEQKPRTYVRMIDVAEAANVSQAAVSHVLSGAGQGKINVSDATAAKIRRVAEELRYHPNHTAQQLRGKPSGIIGIIANDWSQVMQYRALSWLSRLAEERGCHVLSWQTDGKKEALEKYVSQHHSRGVDGLVFLAFENDSLWPHASRLLADVPNVVSVLDNPSFPTADCVESDVADGVRQSVMHLHAQGRRKIVQVLENLDWRINRSRWAGFQAVHGELGRVLPPDALCIAAPGWTCEDLVKYDALCEELVVRRKADAILTLDDFMAAALLRCLRRRGLRVPEDVAIIGWGNDSGCEWVDPMLSSVSYLLRDIMSTTVDCLAEMIEGRASASPRHVLIKPKLFLRESS